MSPPRRLVPLRSLIQPSTLLPLRSLFHPRSRTVAVAIVFGLLVTGCQGDASPPGPTAGETSASAPEPTSPLSTHTTAPSEPAAPEPTAASSDGPAANIPVPEKPALADENSVEGLEAFTEYWFELFSYGYITNDWAEFLEITDSGCGTCANVVEGVQEQFASGGWVAGGEAEVLTFSTDFELNTAGSINSFVEVGQGEVTLFSQSGEAVGESPSSEPGIDVLIAIYEQNRWIMLDFGSPEGT
ncbi:DUF6318 family protein [Arthrobacter sp. 260]|uniref:DUF6318 family protein n=1 Tax=Arthrobacter sp. 260 TaxID=2735314 RepID=UPI001E33DA30|nr:DUF6318 family protein [Arthrobacter sp. 260]